MPSKKEYAAVALLIAGVFLVAGAYNVGVYSRTYQFSYATASGNADGTVVYHLTDGGTLSFSNAWSRDDAAANMTLLAQGGELIVQYSFIGYPVQEDYRA
jgi:hypothetical protein